MSTTKITKLQRTTLEAAALRNNYAAWPIRGAPALNVGSATRAIKELIRRGLVVEKPAEAKAPVWREDGDARLMAVISEAGLEAIGNASGPHGKTSIANGWKEGRRRRPNAAHCGRIAR